MNEYEARELWRQMTPIVREALMEYAALHFERYPISDPVIWLSSRGLITVEMDGQVCGQSLAWMTPTGSGKALMQWVETLGLHI